jgi:hypothetical protein
MDLLDRVLEPGTDLLARVDDILLRTGAPAGHSVWSSLSKVGALPSAAVAAVAALSPTDIRAIAEHLTEVGDGLRDLPDTVPPRLESRGLIADGLTDAWRTLADQISGGPAGPGLTGRLAAGAAQLESIATWAADARRDLAAEIGACLGSAEAVLVRSATDTPEAHSTQAAADIAECVLTAVARSIDDGWHWFGHGAGLDAEVPLVALASGDGLRVGPIELR